MIPIRDINPTRILPLATIALIAINIVAYFAWQPSPDSAEGESFLYEQAAIACELTTGESLTLREARTRQCIDNDTGEQLFPDKNVWLAGFVSMFLHGSILHIAGNMWFLWVFGNNVEEAYGTIGYILLYLVAGIVATAAFVLFNSDATDPLVGASGAIAGVLGAYLVLFPRNRVLTLLFVFFVPIPALFFLGFWFLSQFAVADVGIAWEAHVGGFVLGAAATLILRESLLRRVRSLHTPRMPPPRTPF
ncbi:MAG: rhomboid family intramembrane serine protease [bacterium]|nr:rhomboid family intramembrane serine protease [bacterium]